MIEQIKEIDLKKIYPGLNIDVKQGIVSGDIYFCAGYSQKINEFKQIGDAKLKIKDWVILEDVYSIEIIDKQEGILPKLIIKKPDNILPNPERHINSDQTACLCSPPQEMKFILDGMSFEDYLDYLAIPFLYGQSYYSRVENRWPWPGEAHGVIGILESYYRLDIIGSLKYTLDRLKDILTRTANEKATWELIKSFLIENDVRILKMQKCLCDKPDCISKCHPAAWKGLLKIKDHIIKTKLLIV